MAGTTVSVNNKKSRNDVEVHVCRFIDYKPSTICAADLHVDNKHCAIGRENGNIEIWDLNGSFIQRIIPGKGPNTIQSLLWVYDNKNKNETNNNTKLRLLSCGLDGWLIEWNLETLCIKSKISSNGYGIWDIAQSSNTNNLQISTACDDGKLRIYTLHSNSEFAFSHQFMTAGRCLSTIWSSKTNSNTVFGGTSNGLIFAFDTVSNQQILNIIVAPAPVSKVRRKAANKIRKPLVWSLCNISDEFIACSTSRGSIDIFDVQFGTLIQSVNAAKNDIFSMKYVYNQAQKQHILIAGCCDGRVLQLTCRKDTFVITGYHRYHSHDVNVVSATNNYVISGGIDTQLVLCKTRDFWTHYICSPLAINNTSSNILKIANNLDIALIDNILPSITNTASNASKLSDKLFLYQQAKHLELWYIYGTNPIKMMDINVGFNNTFNILCSNISSNGKWIAISNNHCIKLWKISLSKCKKNIKLVKMFETINRGCTTINFTNDNKYLFITPINNKNKNNNNIKEEKEGKKVDNNDIGKYLDDYKDKQANIIVINVENEEKIMIEKEINICKHIGNYMISSLSLNTDSSLCSIIVPSLRYGAVIHIAFGKIFYQVPFGINNANISCIKFQKNVIENKQVEMLYVIYANNRIKMFYYNYCQDINKLFKLRNNIRLHSWCGTNNKTWNIYNKNNPFSFTNILFNPFTMNKALLLRPEYMFSLVVNRKLPNTYFPAVGSKRTFDMMENGNNKHIEQLIPSPFGKPQSGGTHKNKNKNKLSFLRVIRKYDPMVYAEFIGNNTLLIVHAPWHKVSASFKRPLYRKKYAI